MATGYIYNGFGKYETHYDKETGTAEKGITLFYAGLPWWLPYQKVTAIPNWTLREVDHDRSTPPMGEEGVLTYLSVVVPGTRVVEELIDKQIPSPYSNMGVISIEGRSTGVEETICCGWDMDGRKLTTQVIKREPTRTEIQRAETLAQEYKQSIVSEYFQSKRERMNGGHGKTTPDARMPDSLLRHFMNDLGVEDNDDVTAHAKSAGVNPDLLRSILSEVMGAMNRMNQETVAEAVVTAIKKTSVSAGPKGGTVQNARKGLRNVIDHDKLAAERAAEELAKT